MEFKTFGTMGATFAALVKQGVGILHVIWLPAVLQYAAFLLLAPGFLKASTMLSADPPADGAETWARLAPTLPMMALFVAIVMATSIILTAGLARLLVRGERPKLPFLLQWGKDETRILGCWAIIAAAGIAVAIVFQLFRMLSTLLLSSGPIANLLAIGGGLLIFLAGVWIAVRLSLFTPATVAEQRMGARPSYDMTEDVFWPLLGFWVMWFLMVVVLQFATFGLVTPPAYFEAMRGADFTSPEAMREAMRKGNEAMAAGYDISDMGNVVRMSISFLYNLIVSVVFGVASVVAWKSLKDQAPV